MSPNVVHIPVYVERRHQKNGIHNVIVIYAAVLGSILYHQLDVGITW